MATSTTRQHRWEPDVPAQNDDDPGRAPNPVDLHVGARIRQRRLFLGMTKADLAQGLGLTFQQVHKYELGGRVSASRLYALSQLLQTRVGWFYEGMEDTSGSSDAIRDDAAHDWNSKETGELLRALFHMSPALQRLFSEMIHEMGQTPPPS